MSLSEQEVTVQVGETFDLYIKVDPNGEALDTVRAHVLFSPSVLQVEDVVLAGAFDRVSPGNGVDQERGIMSFGGFTLNGPVTELTDFAKMTVRAMAQGDATIEISPFSRLISNGEEKIQTDHLGKMSVEVVEVVSTTESVVIESSTHPQEEGWYNIAVAQLTWQVQGTQEEAQGYFFVLDQSSTTTPTQSLDALVTSYTTAELQDGIWYAHVRAQLADGTLTKTTHRKIQVDRSPPNLFEIDLTTDQVLENESLQAFFGTTDETSGIDRFELSLNGSAFTSVVSPQTFTNVAVGTYILQVKAIDRAGNETYAQVPFRSYPEGTILPHRPVILSDETRGSVEKLKVLITFAISILAIGGIILYRTHVFGRKK